jgi:indole-3-glycerol phosphate synthase
MYLAEILDHHRAKARDESRDIDALIASLASMPPTRGFRQRLLDDSAGHLAVIAEIKRRSPSKGDLRIDLDPVEFANVYSRAGASCLSVLTDEQFFGGSESDLRQARAACELPVLRKDFTVSLHDVCDARAMGADCILLIVAALDRAELQELFALSRGLGLDVLVEVHDEAELEVAKSLGATLIGVNQRDLRSFEVDRERAVRMAPLMGPDVVKVAESGIVDGSDARILRDAGYHAVLVGETLVRANEPEGVLSSLLVE